MNEVQNYRRLLHQLMDLVPESARNTASYLDAAQLACARKSNVIHLIYRGKPYESYHKDYQFGQWAMNEHWSSGLSDMLATLEHPDWLEIPGDQEPFVTHDLHRVEVNETRG